MFQFKVHLINGTILETIKPVKSFIVKEDFTFFYSEDNQQGCGVAAVANTQICSIVLEEM